MKLYIDESYIPEEKTSLSPNTSYVVMLSDKEKKSLEKLQKRYEYLIDKRKSELSSFVKVVLLNTYLYLNNTERDLSEDISTILKKNYYKDLNKDFIKMISEPGKEQDFIREIIRTRILKTQSSTTEDEGSEKEKFQFRLAQDDDLLRYIFAGTVCMPIADYLSSLMDYFLSASLSTQRTILQYQMMLSLKRCIADQRCVMINGRKRYVLKIGKSKMLLFNAIWGLDRKEHRIYRVPLFEIKELEETNEYFDLTSNERNAIEALKNAGEVIVSFKIINEGFNPLKYLPFHQPMSLELNSENDETTKTKRCLTDFDTARRIEKILLKHKDIDIADLTFSDNYAKVYKIFEDNGMKL